MEPEEYREIAASEMDRVMDTIESGQDTYFLTNGEYQGMNQTECGFDDSELPIGSVQRCVVDAYSIPAGKGYMHVVILELGDGTWQRCVQRGPGNYATDGWEDASVI